VGLLIDGEWQDQWYDTSATGGQFVRKESAYRDWITPDGTEAGFKAEPGRYHLYVSLACPWAHRVLIMRALKGLDEAISISVVNWFMGENGWNFAPGPGVVADGIHHAEYLYQVYLAADPKYTGRVTVPVLWDKLSGRIVNNESSEIIRMLNSAFDGVGARPGDYYPEALRHEIDEINARVYATVNNGVYKAGFATTQAAYEEAVVPLFESLDWLEAKLTNRRYLLGKALTEADIRLFTTLVRFDPVYAGHFKCNLRRVQDYPQLWAYTRDIYQIPGVAETVNFQQIKQHYYGSHASINPSRIVPLGPVLDFNAPHRRENL
jgi:putative glutathione S-transferase